MLSLLNREVIAMKVLARFVVAFVLVLPFVGGVHAKDSTSLHQEKYVISPEALKRLSPSELQSEAVRRVQQTRETLSRVMNAYAEAERSNDVARSRCLSEVLTLMKGLRRLVEQNLDSLREAMAKQDSKEATHQFVKIVIASNRMAELFGRAQGCGGPGLQTIFEGKPVVEKYAAKYIPIDDQKTGVYVLWMPSVEPPPQASPFY